MLDPEIAGRVAELEAAGTPSGDAIGQALWERDHAADSNSWYDEDDPDEEWPRDE